MSMVKTKRQIIIIICDDLIASIEAMGVKSNYLGEDLIKLEV